MQSIREPFRIAAIGPALFPNTATMYGLEDARVMTAMSLWPFMTKRSPPGAAAAGTDSIRSTT